MSARDRFSRAPLARPLARQSPALQRRALAISQRISAGSQRGLMYSGADGLSIQRSACPTMPGAASGGAWLGVSVPQLPCDAAPPTRPCSSRRTERPSASR